MSAAKKDLENNDRVTIPDPLKLAHILNDVSLKAQPVLIQIQKELSKHTPDSNLFDPLQVQGVMRQWIDNMFSNPAGMMQMQMNYWQNWMDMTNKIGHDFVHGDALPQQSHQDRRFRAQEWQTNPWFRFLKESYQLTSNYFLQSIMQTEGLDDLERQKLTFAAKQWLDSIAPSNFLLTNPDVLRETMETGGENLLKGLENFLNDLQRGQGRLKISMTDYNAFTLGETLAATKGSVVYRNEIMELIQYAPQTQDVNKTPIIIIPPWINKYYILDLKPENSYVSWLVSQGHTVFMVSWNNPDMGSTSRSFEDYMKEGVLSALKKVQQITHEKQAHMVGYCIGGTLLSMTLSWLHAHDRGDEVKSATFLTTLLDFEESGDLKLFAGEEQITAIEKLIGDRGVLDGRYMQATFNMLRANDLIWSFIVNNYLMGKEPFPFDLLYWNDDSTNMPGKLHIDYLRSMYLNNCLMTPNAFKIDGVGVDLSKIRTPAFFLSTREDHIAPWRATYSGMRAYGGPSTFTLAQSGHIAGVVNAPSSGKYGYWVSDKTAMNPEEWLNTAAPKAGSWWPEWENWLQNFGAEKVPARQISKSLCPAPGEYVLKRAG